MHLSGPLRGVASKGSTASGSLSSEEGGRMTMIAIARVDPQGVVHWSARLARVPTVRVDSTVERLTSFPEDQLVQTQSGSLLFSDMWMVLLSWRVAKLDPR